MLYIFQSRIPIWFLQKMSTRKFQASKNVIIVYTNNNTSEKNSLKFNKVKDKELNWVSSRYNNTIN